LINSKNKGQRAEREACKLLWRHGWAASRNWQAAGAKERPDLHTAFPAHIEVKCVEKLNIYKAMTQAMCDAKPGTEPIVLHKRNNFKWLVTIDADSYFTYMNEIIKKEQNV
jgi:Holliday junction resolvase